MSSKMIHDQIKRKIFLQILMRDQIKREAALKRLAEGFADKPEYLAELDTWSQKYLKNLYNAQRDQALLTKRRLEKFFSRHAIYTQQKLAVTTLEHVEQMRRDAMRSKHWDEDAFKIVLVRMATNNAVPPLEGQVLNDDVIKEMQTVGISAPRKDTLTVPLEAANQALEKGERPLIPTMPDMAEELVVEDVGRLVNVMPWPLAVEVAVAEEVDEFEEIAEFEEFDEFEEFEDLKSHYIESELEEARPNILRTLSRKEIRAKKRLDEEERVARERERIDAILAKMVHTTPTSTSISERSNPRRHVAAQPAVIGFGGQRLEVKRRSNPKLEELKVFAEEYRRMVESSDPTAPDPLAEIEYDPQQSILSSADVVGTFDSADEISKSCIFSHSALTTHSDHLPQYAILGHRRIDPSSPSSASASSSPSKWDFLWRTIGNTKKQIIPQDQKLYINANHPWSAFICGLQGSGKSHTMSTLLESFLIRSPLVGKLERPMSGLVFHYSQYNSNTFFQPCEAAFLSYPAPEFAKSHKGVPVTVIVSPSNYIAMKEAYSAIPGITVKKFRIHPEQLNVTSMLELMAMDKEAKQPLYMQGVQLLLRKMAENSSHFDWHLFRHELQNLKLSPSQRGPLEQRMSLLESFIDDKHRHRGNGDDRNMFNAEDGRLTIIDLSDPFVDESLACVLFNISMRIYLESNESCGKVIGVDEAHKYISAASPSSKVLTESLLSLIRQQRHFGVRVLISTQEPTIDHRLIDLSAVTFIHRFTSPTWYAMLRRHIILDDEAGESVMAKIAGLRTGEAFVSAPTAAVAGEDEMERLGSSLLLCKIRKRLTWDGGRSITGTMGTGRERKGEESEVD